MNINIYSLSNRILALYSFVFDGVFDDKSCWAVLGVLYTHSRGCNFYRGVLSSNRSISNAPWLRICYWVHC